MTFLANPHFILQISHAMSFKMKHTRCAYSNIIQIFIKSQGQIMCGSNFYESDVKSTIDLDPYWKEPKS